MTTRSTSPSRLGSLPSTVVAALIVSLMGCDDATVEQVAPIAEVRELGGIYRVSGTTVELGGGVSRNISGLVVLRQEGKH